MLRDISEQLERIFAGLTERGVMNNFLNDLLTKTERTMLAKRLAIAVMLDVGYPFRVISRLLKVSEATVSVMRERMDKGGRGFAAVLARLKQNTRFVRTLRTLEETAETLMRQANNK